MQIGLGDLVTLFAVIFLPIGFLLGRVTGRRKK